MHRFHQTRLVPGWHVQECPRLLCQLIHWHVQQRMVTNAGVDWTHPPKQHLAIPIFNESRERDLHHVNV